MTNHIASTSRWRLRAGVLRLLAGRTLDHLRQAFSGFIAPELAAEAVRRSAQRPVALLPAPAAEPTLVGLVEELPQSGLDATEPVAATPAVAADGDTIEQPLAVQNLPDDQPAPIPLRDAAERVTLRDKTAEAPAIMLAPAQPAAAFSPDTLQRGHRARIQSAVPVAVGQALAKPVSLRRTVSRQARKGGPAVDAPSSWPRGAEPAAAMPPPTEVAAEGGTPTPVDVFAPEVQPTPRASHGDTTQGEPPTTAAEESGAGLAPAEPAAALPPDTEKRVGRARNKTSDPAAVPQAQADAVAPRRTVRKPRRVGQAIAAGGAADSEETANTRELAG
jgi:hypothetical protein